MTRRWWLPYAAWALMVGTGLVLTQPGFAYCAGLHPRMCANALYANLPGAWDPGGAIAAAVVLAIGWTIIAAWRVSRSEHRAGVRRVDRPRGHSAAVFRPVDPNVPRADRHHR